MEKICVAYWREPDTNPAALAGWLDKAGAALGEDPGVLGATIHVESEHPQAQVLRYGAGRDGRLLAGLVSVWVDTYNRAPVLDAALAAPPAAEQASWLVTESVVKPYGAVMSWPEGTRSPGLSIVTVLDKPPATDEATFYHYWHELHLRTTLECHPFASYVRNEASRALSAGAPACRGVVTESSPHAEDFLDPHRFYMSGGDPARLRANQKRVIEETSVFLHYATLQVAPMSETVVRRLSPSSP